MRGVAARNEASVSNPERVAQLDDEPAPLGEVGVRRRDSLKLDERPKPLDLIEMDARALPQQPMTALGDDPPRMPITAASAAYSRT